MQPALVGNKKVPGGPRGYPIVGVMFDFPRDRRKFLTNVARQYGDVAQFSIANIKFYEVVHPDGVKHVLQDNANNYERGKMFDPIRNLIGNGLLLSDGAFWQRQRGLMAPAYHMQNITRFGERITSETNNLVKLWLDNAMKGQTFDALHDLFGMTMKMTTQTVFGNETAEDSDAISRSITILLENISFHFETPFYPSLSVPTPRNRQLVKALQGFDQILFRSMAERRRKEQTAGAGLGDDLLGMFMAARSADGGQGMSDQELRSEILTVFATGPEPTSIALSWAFYFLSKNPDVQQQLMAELAQVLNGRLPTVADLPKLVYTRMVLQESLRLFPPAWLVNRSAIADDEIGGYSIPAGGVIMMSPYLTHRHADFWDDPEKFDPLRFTPERSNGRHEYAYFPFGLGPHQCIGMDLAMLQAQLAFATLAQRLSLELLPDANMEVVSSLMLHPSQLLVSAKPLS
jgi:cytochrome P450